MIPERLKTKIAQNPRSLFVIDGLGALVSAISLGLVLSNLVGIFGIPQETLYLLASFPVFFALFDLLSYRQKKGIRRNLRAIAWANLLYCGLSIVLSFYHFETITLWGWAYIIGEVLIVVFLALLELKAAGLSKAAQAQ